MKKRELILVIAVCVFTFLIAYFPHYSYHLPLHIDEWKQLGEARSIVDSGLKVENTHNLEIGFNIILAFLYKIADPIQIYQYLPVIWAVLSALVLFFVVYKKTDRFYMALFAMIFFASIKSNSNLTGLWFFTPLTFSIPLIFLYVYYFTEGIEKDNRKYLVISFLLMIILIPIHAISILFALPFLLIYCIIKRKDLYKRKEIFIFPLLIVILGLIFYILANDFSISKNIFGLLSQLSFKKGWGVLELNNSPFEIYSLMGYILAAFGIFAIIYKKESKKYLAYLLWPLTLIIMIAIFKITDYSYLSPYQRNMYYLAISLPLLSAVGLYNLLLIIKSSLKKSGSKKVIATILVLVCLITIFFTFLKYDDIPQQISIYHLITNDDYKALQYLNALNKSTIIAPEDIGSATYAVSGQTPLATIYFDNTNKSKQDVNKFFTSPDCTTKQKIIKRYKVEYVLSRYNLDCNWTILYDKNDYIYLVGK